jgi:hypothetical protein
MLQDSYDNEALKYHLGTTHWHTLESSSVLAQQAVWHRDLHTANAADIQQVENARLELHVPHLAADEDGVAHRVRATR